MSKSLKAKGQKQAQKSKKNKAGGIIKEPLRIINHLGPACPAIPQTGFFGFKA